MEEIEQKRMQLQKEPGIHHTGHSDSAAIPILAGVRPSASKFLDAFRIKGIGRIVLWQSIGLDLLRFPKSASDTYVKSPEVFIYFSLILPTLTSH